MRDVYNILKLWTGWKPTKITVLQRSQCWKNY